MAGEAREENQPVGAPQPRCNRIRTPFEFDIASAHRYGRLMRIGPPTVITGLGLFGGREALNVSRKPLRQFASTGRSLRHVKDKTLLLIDRRDDLPAV